MATLDSGIEALNQVYRVWQTERSRTDLNRISDANELIASYIPLNEVFTAIGVRDDDRALARDTVDSFLHYLEQCPGPIMLFGRKLESF